MKICKLLMVSNNFESNNVTFTWPEPAEMLHSDGTDAGGISAKGFMTFGAVDPDIAFAKLKSLSEGAALATSRL